MTELKPCPFCGSTDIDPEGVACFKPEYKGGSVGWDKATDDMIVHRPACNSCGATTDGDWNTRAEPAPLPDEVEKCLIELETFANKQMEREFLTTGGSSFAGWMPTSSEFVDTIRAHIAALEAENKKLINAITHAIAMLEIDAEADYAVDFTCTINILNEALSQTVAAQKQPEVSDKAVCGYQVSDKQHEPQKCGTCGGDGIEKYRMKTWNRELKKYEWNKCPDCNGTGKAGE